jgi:hypothetical protein
MGKINKAEEPDILDLASMHEIALPYISIVITQSHSFHKSLSLRFEIMGWGIE